MYMYAHMQLQQDLPSCSKSPIVQCLEKPSWRALPRYDVESKSCWFIVDALTRKFVHGTLCERIILPRHHMAHELAGRLLDVYVCMYV